MEVRKVIGVVKAYARAIKEKKTEKGMIYSRGVKIGYVEPLDGESEVWHNVVAFGDKSAFEALEQLPDAFPKGMMVRFGERKNGDYWNFMEGTLEAHTGPENKPVVEVQMRVEEETVRNPKPKIDMNTSILRQVFLKVAVQAVCKNFEHIREDVDIEVITPKSVVLFAQGLEEEWDKWEAKKP